MEKTKVGIVGMGTVGTGVAKLLLDHGDRTALHAGRVLWLEKVVVRDASKARGCELPDSVLTDDLSAITDNDEITVVAQLVGVDGGQVPAAGNDHPERHGFASERSQLSDRLPGASDCEPFALGCSVDDVATVVAEIPD